MSTSTPVRRSRPGSFRTRSGTGGSDRPRFFGTADSEPTVDVIDDEPTVEEPLLGFFGADRFDYQYDEDLDTREFDDELADDESYDDQSHDEPGADGPAAASPVLAVDDPVPSELVPSDPVPSEPGGSGGDAGKTGLGRTKLGRIRLGRIKLGPIKLGGGGSAGPDSGKPASTRRMRLTLLDTLATATLGPRGRPMRAALSSLGVAIGIAALVAVLGIPACLEAQARKVYDAWGANLVVAAPATDPRNPQQSVPIPETAPAMVARIWPAKSTLTIRTLDDVYVYRTDKVPAGASKGIAAVIGDGDPMGTLSTTMASGRWFDAASSQLPTVVLGQTAASLLGAGVGHRIWAGQSWWEVIGVLGPLPPIAAQLDNAVFLASGWAERSWPDTPISQIMVNAEPGQAAAVRLVLAATVNPGQPSGVSVSQPGGGSFDKGQDFLFGMFTKLALGLGGIALLVGGIGIANTMILSVMERRGEIGVRRALGARTGQIGLQFVLEAAVIGLIGGLIGVGLGVYAVLCFSIYTDNAFAVPAWVIPTGPLLAVGVGVIAGLYPSITAARQSPTVTLRAL